MSSWVGWLGRQKYAAELQWLKQFGPFESLMNSAGAMRNTKEFIVCKQLFDWFYSIKIYLSSHQIIVLLPDKKLRLLAVACTGWKIRMFFQIRCDPDLYCMGGFCKQKNGDHPGCLPYKC